MARRLPYGPMATDLSTLMGDTTADSSTETDDDDSDDYSELREACEAIGANAENAIQYVKNNGGEDSLVEFAEKLADDEELWELQEEYRQMNDVHRIRQSFLYDAEGDFSVWTANFYYGGPDRKENNNPSRDSYNGVQTASRDADGNLAYYKALFPEPVERFWDSDAILYAERPDDDSHIYITESWFDEFSDFTFEVDGEPKVRPPTNAELRELAEQNQTDSDSSGSDNSDDLPQAPIAVPTYNVSELKEKVRESDFTADELRAILASEKRTEDRKTVKNWLPGRIEEAESDEQKTLDESASEMSSSAIAGDLLANHDLPGADPEMLKAMLDGGMSREEVVAKFQ